MRFLSLYLLGRLIGFKVLNMTEDRRKWMVPVRNGIYSTYKNKKMTRLITSIKIKWVIKKDSQQTNSRTWFIDECYQTFR